MTRGAPPLIVGIGNLLRRDDGVGQEVAEALWLRRDHLSFMRDARFVMAQQLTPELAQDLSEAGAAVFIDAAFRAGPVGSVVVRTLVPSGQAATFAAAGMGCWQDLGPGTLLSLAESLFGYAPPSLLVTVCGADDNVGAGLSPLVSTAVPIAVIAVERALRGPFAKSTVAGQRWPTTLGRVKSA